MGSELQGHLTERCDALYGEVPQTPIVPGSFTRIAGFAVIVHAAGAESDPGKETLHETATFWQCFDGLQDGPGEQPKVPGICRDIHLTHAINNPVEGMSACSLEPGFSIAG